MALEKRKEGKERWIHCSIIIEVLGKPKEYLKEIMEGIVKNLKSNEHIELLKDKIADIHPVEKLFSSFVELEMLVENINVLQSLIFAYMPSSIEILNPQELKMSLNDANLFFNDLGARLHEYDNKLKKYKVLSIMLNEKIKKLEEQVKEKKEKESAETKERKRDEEKNVEEAKTSEENNN